MKILIVEDDKLLAGVIAEYLNDHLHIVDIAGNGESAWDQIKVSEYDLILLDLLLPKLDGISLCKRLRSHGYSVPVLMITARDTSTDKVLGLDSGADDYMVKPLDFPELSARIRALLRRGSFDSSPALTWGDLSLDSATYEVNYNQQTLRLTLKEYSLLELFLLNGRQILSRSLIIEHLWPFEEPPDEDTIKTHIKSLRRKLRIVGAPTDIIETVHGVGYRLKQ